MKIDKAIYQGYLWYSDTDTPRILNNEEYGQEIDDGANPFIVEGMLWCEITNMSISIRYIDGKYYAKKYENVCVGENDDKVEYFANNKIGNKKLKFIREWIAEPDKLCEGMPALRPGSLIFVGFKNIGEE